MASNQELINSYKEQWAAANAKGDKVGMDAAHAGAESVRATEGYSGGVDGSEYIPLAKTQSSTNTTDQYLNEMYAAQEAKAKAELDAAYQKNVNVLNATAAKIPETYNTARNQTAASAEQNKASFNEQAAARGINSGAASQANLAMNNTLTGSLGSLNNQEAAAITNVNNQRTQLATDYNNAIASAVAENNLAKAQALYQEKVRLDSNLLELQQYQTQLDMKNKQYSDTLASNNAEALASIGDFSGFKQAPYNWTDAQVAQAQALFQQQNTAKTYGYSGGGSGSSETTTPITDNSPMFGTTYKDANTQVNNWIAQGYSYNQMKSQLNTEFNNGNIDSEEYKTYNLIIDANAHDAGQKARA